MSELDLDQRLDQAVKESKKLQTAIERLQGRKEQAEANLKAIQEECEAKKINPEKIDETIDQLTKKYESLIEDIEKQVEEAQEALAPFVGGNEQT